MSLPLLCNLGLVPIIKVSQPTRRKLSAVAHTVCFRHNSECNQIFQQEFEKSTYFLSIHCFMGHKCFNPARLRGLLHIKHMHSTVGQTMTYMMHTYRNTVIYLSEMSQRYEKQILPKPSSKNIVLTVIFIVLYLTCLAWYMLSVCLVSLSLYQTSSIYV